MKSPIQKSNIVNLIIPPISYLISSKVFPPLGILYVAAVLEQNKIPVRITDLIDKKDNWQKEVIKLAKQSSDYIGLSATTPDFPMCLAILKLIKEINPSKKVIIGGPHATIAPEQCTMFDKIVVGDGFKGILEAIKDDSPKIIKTELEDFDDILMPARHLIDLNSYDYMINGRKATTIIGQMGCPYNCIYCCGRDTDYYKKVRKRSIKNIIKELDFLNKEYGYSAFMFFDDEMNLDKSRLLELCLALKQRAYIWRGLIRSNLFDEEIAKAMSESGCVEIGCGVESGSARILELIKKETTPEINTKTRNLCKKYNIRFKALTMIGLPSETREEVLMTKQWLLDNNPDDFDITILTPYPSSEIYAHTERFDIEFNLDYRKDAVFFKGIPGEYKSYVKNSNMTHEEIVSLRKEIEDDVKKAIWKPKMTVLLLNWKRRENLDIIITALSKQIERPRIFLWNNSPISFEDKRIDWIANSNKNVIAYPRWLMASMADTEYIMTLDDDLMPDSNYFISVAIREVGDHPDSIIGLFGRIIPDKPPPYYKTSDVSHVADIIKGRCMIMKTEMLKQIPLYTGEKITREDDIYVSHILAKGRKTPHIVSRELRSMIKELPDKHSLESDKNHLDIRENFLKGLVEGKNEKT